MNEDQAADILRSLRSDLGTARKTVADAQRRVGALEKLVEGYVELFPGLADDATVDLGDAASTSYSPQALSDDRPRGQDAVLQVMAAEEFRGRYWTVAQMTQELADRGWAPESDNPLNAVRTSLTRLAEANDRVKKGGGRKGGVVFYYQAEGMPEPHFHEQNGPGSGLMLMDPHPFRPVPDRF